MDLRIERRRSLSPAEDAGFVAVYEASFPPDERDQTRDLLASIGAGDRICHLALLGSPSEDVVGLAVIKEFSIPGTAALEYLAVHPARRCQGIGARLLRHIRQDLASSGGPARGFLLEGDPPAEAVGAEQEIRRRRIRFYQRNGARIVEAAPAFRAPSFDGRVGLPYVLMWLPAADSSDVPEGDLLVDLVAAMLIESYGLDPADPLVGEVLGGLVQT